MFQIILSHNLPVLWAGFFILNPSYKALNTTKLEKLISIQFFFASNLQVNLIFLDSIDK